MQRPFDCGNDEKVALPYLIIFKTDWKGRAKSTKAEHDLDSANPFFHGYGGEK